MVMKSRSSIVLMAPQEARCRALNKSVGVFGLPMGAERSRGKRTCMERGSGYHSGHRAVRSPEDSSGKQRIDSQNAGDKLAFSRGKEKALYAWQDA